MASIILKNVRLAFPELFEPKSFAGEEEGTKRYSANFLVEPGSENDKLIRKTISDAVKEKFPDPKKAEQFLKSVQGNSGKFCFNDGDAKSYDGYEGMWYVSANRNEDQGAPSVVSGRKDESGKLIPLTKASGKPYAGCYVNGKIDIWVQTGKYNGVRASLQAVQFVADGDAFAGAPASADGFDELDSDDDTGFDWEPKKNEYY